MIAYPATLDVPRELAQFVEKLPLAERRRRGTPRGSRALTCFWQAVMGLRWFRDRTSLEALAQTTASRGPPRLRSASSCARSVRTSSGTRSIAKTLTRRPHTPRCVRLGRSIMAESEHGWAAPND